MMAVEDRVDRGKILEIPRKTVKPRRARESGGIHDDV
jgi:hypothetical protein